MTVNQRKRELKAKYIDNNPALTQGRRTVLISMLIIFFARIAFFIFELVYFSQKGLSVSVISNLLLLPLCLILYMIYDGNKGLSAVPAISAIVRIIVYFSVTHKAVLAVGGGLYTGILIGVMVIQFLVCVLVSSASRCQAYYKVVQRINLAVQKEFISGRR